MSTTTTSSVRFIVAASIGDNRWRKIGFAEVKGARCKLDEAVIATYPKGTVTYEQIKKACKWVAGENAAVSADFTTRHNLLLKVISI